MDLHHWQLYSLIRPFCFINMTILLRPFFFSKCHCTAQKHQNKTKTLNLLTYLCVLTMHSKKGQIDQINTEPRLHTAENSKMINSSMNITTILCVNQRIIVFLYFFFVFFFNFNIVTNDADIILTLMLYKMILCNTKKLLTLASKNQISSSSELRHFTPFCCRAHKTKKKTFFFIKITKSIQKSKEKKSFSKSQSNDFSIFFVPLSCECYSAFCTKWQVRKVKESNEIYVRFLCIFFIDVVLCVEPSSC